MTLVINRAEDTGLYFHTSDGPIYIHFAKWNKQFSSMKLAIDAPKGVDVERSELLVKRRAAELKDRNASLRKRLAELAKERKKKNGQ